MPICFWFIDLPPDIINPIILGLDVLEAVLLLGTLPITGVTFYLFYKCPLIHRNTVYLGVNVYVVYLVLTIARLLGIFIFTSLGNENTDKDDYYIGVAVSTVYLSGPLAAVQLLRLIALGVFIGVCPCLIIERLFITLYIKTYESRSHPRFFGLIIAQQWICSAVIVYLFCMNSISLFIIVIFVLLVTLICLVVFAYCSTIYNRQYHQYQQNFISLTLSERYQLAVNMRTTRLLYKLVVGMMVCNVICILHFNNFRVKKKFFQLCRPRIHVEETRQDLRKRLDFIVNSKGYPMVFDLEKEPKIYFETLMNIWNGPINSAATKYVIKENANSS